jgi:hypothetical protein
MTEVKVGALGPAMDAEAVVAAGTARSSEASRTAAGFVNLRFMIYSF